MSRSPAAPENARLLRRATAGRTPEDRLAVVAPGAYRRLCAAVWGVVGRLPPGSRIRRAVLLRGCLRAYAAFNRGDLPVFLSTFDPDIVYEVSEVRDWPEEQRVEGLAGVRDMALNWHRSWHFCFELQELHDLGRDRFLLLGEFSMTGTESGVPLDHVGWAQIGTVRHGRWIRVENFTDPSDARRAAGLA